MSIEIWRLEGFDAIVPGSPWVAETYSVVRDMRRGGEASCVHWLDPQSGQYIVHGEPPLSRRARRRAKRDNAAGRLGG